MPIDQLQKDVQNIQFARVAQPTGKRTIAFGVPFQPDQGTEPLADDNGRLIVRVADNNGYIGDNVKPITSQAYTNSWSTPDPAILYQISGFSVSSNILFLQIFNTNTANPPLVGNVPGFFGGNDGLSMLVQPGSNFCYEPKYPWTLSNGIYILASQYGDRYQPPFTTNQFWLNIEYKLL